MNERTHTPTKPQRDLIKRWIERLRNPNSRQAKGRLKGEKGRGFCCLGHLCIVAGKEFKDGRCEGESCALPLSVALDVGVNCSYPAARIGSKAYELDELNDNHGFTLREIADVIEADWIKGRPLKSHKKLA